MGAIEVIVTVVYGKAKASRMIDMPFGDMVEDLLKISRPNLNRIRRPTSEGVTISWITERNSVRVRYWIITSEPLTCFDL